MSRGLLLRLLLVIALLGALAFVGLYFLRPVVTVAPVRRGTAHSGVPGTVTVRAERTYRVVTELAGRITENNLKVGQTVQEGDVLVQIDSKALEIEIEQNRGQLAAVNKQIELGSTRQFQLENERARLGYMKDLLTNNAIPPADVEAKEREIKGIEQAVELERAALDLQKANLEAQLKAKENALAKLTLRSPIDGIVSRVEAFAGDLVGGGTLIAEVISLTRVVDVKISEENFDYVKIGQNAIVRLAGYGADKFNGQVSKLATTVDAATQRNIVELQVTADVTKLVPGMTGEAVITVSERPNALLVPRPALIGNILYVIDSGRVNRRTVQVGFTALNEAEIIEGVTENEFVALDQLDLLNDGTRVRVRTAD